MKNIRLFGIVLMLFALGMFLSSYSRAAAEAPTPRLITVTGDADVKVVPDEVVFMIGVETWDKDLNLAQSQNDERVKKILALTKEMAIDPKYVQTDRISVEPRYRDGYTRADFVGFFVRKSIVITLKDTDKFEALQTGALNAGATHIHGVQYRTTELRK